MEMHALVVEDEPALQMFYRKVLEKTNYTVQAARDGREAVAILESIPLPHLMILDIRLPDMDGIEVLEYMAQRPDLQGIHVVIASAGKEYERYLGIMPSSEFLLKPVLPTQIIMIAQRVRDGLMA